MLPSAIAWASPSVTGYCNFQRAKSQTTRSPTTHGRPASAQDAGKVTKSAGEPENASQYQTTPYYLRTPTLQYDPVRVYKPPSTVQTKTAFFLTPPRSGLAAGASNANSNPIVEQTRSRYDGIVAAKRKVNDKSYAYVT